MRCRTHAMYSCTCNVKRRTANLWRCASLPSISSVILNFHLFCCHSNSSRTKCVWQRFNQTVKFKVYFKNISREVMANFGKSRCESLRTFSIYISIVQNDSGSIYPCFNWKTKLRLKRIFANSIFHIRVLLTPLLRSRCTGNYF